MRPAFLSLFVLAALHPLVAGPKVYEDSIAGDSPRDEGNNVYDLHELPVMEGQSVVIAVQAPGFDAFLSVTTPQGAVLECDDDSDSVLTRPDAQGNSTTGFSYTDPHVVVSGGQAGKLQVRVRSLDGQVPPAGQNSYKLYYGILDTSEPVLEHRDRLDTDDLVDRQGHLADRIEFDLTGIDTATIDLRGAESMDTILQVMSPTGNYFQNDDSGSVNHSAVTIVEAEEGIYTAWVRTLDPSSRGSYTLTVTPSSDISEALGLERITDDADADADAAPDTIESPAA